MKLKEIDRNGNITWSPKVLDKSYLVVGTASQQIDSSFSSKAQLEIFEYVPNSKGCDMPLIQSLASDHKFSKLLWGNVSDNYGLIVGGSDAGTISIYDCKILFNENRNSLQPFSKSLIIREHKGPVHAMDFNKFKSNLLATGGAESDIFIWDLDKYDEPMTPGNKSQPFEEIRNLSWNHKVQHILGSTSTHRCQIWDLRKSDPVIKLSDTQMKMKCNKLVWHPEISTRLCISSEDDHTPVIQIWDLRYIQCPFHTLQRHTKGIIDLEWSLDDPDILMSVGRDRQIICWNMSASNTSSSQNTSSDVIYEWQLDQELINEANFLPKHPGVVSISSFDCHISLYNLMGGQCHVSQELSDTVIDSFPLELFEDTNEIERVKKEAEKAAELQLAPTPCLSKAPKWLKRPCGASFSFGGRLVQFCKPEPSRSRNNSVSNTTGSSIASDSVYKILISQVTTHKYVAEESVILENACQNSDLLLQYCQNKIDTITAQINESYDMGSNCALDLDIWKFIECHFFEDSRSAFMQNLGYGNTRTTFEEPQLNENNDSFFNSNYENSYQESGKIINEQVEFPVNNLQLLPRFEGVEKDLSVSLMTGDIDTAINICLRENRIGEAAILAVSSGRQDLFERVQNSIFEKKSNQSVTTNLIHIAVKRNWQELVERCDLVYWRETLVWLLTYASTEELTELCEALGRRLEDRAINEPIFSLSACICYICSGSIDSFVRCWLKHNFLQSTKDLKRLMEMIVVLCKSVGDNEFSLIKGEASRIFRRYALLLVSQGNLSTALRYLGNNEDNIIVELRHRICESIRNILPEGIIAPKLPFKVSSIMGRDVNNQKFKSPPNVPVCNLSDNMKSNNQKHSEFPGHGDYRMNHSQFSPGGSIKSPQMISNEHQFNYTNNSQLNYNFPMSASNAPPNYYHGQYQPQPPSPKLPFLPTGGNSFMPNNAPVQVSGPPMIQKPSIQTNKSAWNDPPLLSENYRQEEINKDEIATKPIFFNPASNVSNISDFVNLHNNKIPVNVSHSADTPTNPLNSFTHSMSTAIDRSLPTTFETPYNQPVVESAINSQIEKLSPEYEHILMVLISLIEKCRLTDKSRQIKVKMDDIEKKINNLFDILRSQSLSIELTNGLKSLISTIERCQYRQSFDEVNHLIQTVNFSEAGLYLPSVKMLIQCAIKILG